MARTLWFAAGAGAGVYAMVRVRRLAQAVTFDGIRDRLLGIGAAARVLREEVAVHREEREIQLRHQLGLVPHGVPQLAPAPTDEERGGP